jgi:hypothetical protein
MRTEEEQNEEGKCKEEGEKKTVGKNTEVGEVKNVVKNKEEGEEKNVGENIEEGEEKNVGRKTELISFPVGPAWSSGFLVSSGALPCASSPRERFAAEDKRSCQSM